MNVWRRPIGSDRKVLLVVPLGLTFEEPQSRTTQTGLGLTDGEVDVTVLLISLDVVIANDAETMIQPTCGPAELLTYKTFTHL
jgi:hypothetical protein